MTFADEVDALGEDAYEALRAIAHRTQHQIPPAEAYQIIGSLKRTPHLLPQLFTEIARGLLESLDTFEITEHLDRPLEEGELPPEPTVKMTEAAEHLMKAAKLSAQAGLELEKAQTAVSTQSHQPKPLPLEPAEEN